MSLLFELGLRILVGAAGLLAILFAIFLFETEEGAVQNKLDAWWVMIDDLQKKALSRQEAFVTVLARLFTATLDWVFGARLLSARSLGASACLVLASQGLFNIRIAMSGSLGEMSPSALEASVFLLIALVGILGSGRPVILYSALIIDFLWSGVALLMDEIFEFDRELWSRIVVGSIWTWVGGAVLNLTLLTIARYSLRPTPGLRPRRPSSRRLVLAAVIHICFLLLPLSFFWSPNLLRVISRPPLVEFPDFWWTVIMINTTIMALSLPAASLLGLGGLLVAHQLLWPTVSRPMYAIARYGMIKRKKLMIGIGATLLSLALAPLHTWWSVVVGKL